MLLEASIAIPSGDITVLRRYTPSTGVVLQSKLWAASPTAHEGTNVEIIPVGVTFRTPLPSSAIYMLPEESKATPRGVPRRALVAGPPSPSPYCPTCPFPATTVAIPDATL